MRPSSMFAGNASRPLLKNELLLAPSPTLPSPTAVRKDRQTSTKPHAFICEVSPPPPLRSRVGCFAPSCLYWFSLPFSLRFVRRSIFPLPLPTGVVFARRDDGRHASPARHVPQFWGGRYRAPRRPAAPLIGCAPRLPDSPPESSDFYNLAESAVAPSPLSMRTGVAPAALVNKRHCL